MKAFKKAKKEQLWLRIALEGVAGSGKTWNALHMATEIAKSVNTRIAVIDTERGSASLYSDDFDFDVLILNDHKPVDYIDAIELALQNGYQTIVIDSISHEWEQVLHIAARNDLKTGGWKAATPQHNSFINTILGAQAHMICTMRQVARYTEDSWGKGKRPVKIGEKPKQREGIDYEFTVVFDVDHQSHELNTSKTRCSLLDNRSYAKGGDAAKVLLEWLGVLDMEKSVEVKKPMIRANGSKRAKQIESEEAMQAGKLEHSRQEQVDALLADLRDIKTLDELTFFGNATMKPYDDIVKERIKPTYREVLTKLKSKEKDKPINAIKAQLATPHKEIRKPGPLQEPQV